MANLITSIAALETPEYSLYIKPLVESPDFGALPFELIQAKAGMPRDIFFNTNLDKVIREKTSCGWSFVGGTEFTKKTLTPVEIQAAVEQCYKVLEGSLYAGSLPDGYLRGELTPEITDFMVSQQQYAFNRDLLTLLLLGDTAISEGTAYYSIIDGIYAKLTGSTYDAGAISDSDLLPANIEGTMYDIYNAQSQLLRQVPANQKKFIVTGTVYDAWLRYLQIGTGLNGAANPDRNSIMNGVTTAMYQGIELVPFRIVDERLNADFLTGSPAAPTDPHRVILTTPMNHKIVVDGNAFKDTNMWFEKKDDKVYATGSALIAYEYGYDELNVIAGF